MSQTYNTGDVGFCPYVGHSGGMIITWEDNTVISVECSAENHEVCGYSETCKFYQRHPVGFVKTFPLSNGSV